MRAVRHRDVQHARRNSVDCDVGVEGKRRLGLPDVQLEAGPAGRRQPAVGSITIPVVVNQVEVLPRFSPVQRILRPVVEIVGIVARLDGVPVVHGLAVGVPIIDAKPVDISRLKRNARVGIVGGGIADAEGAVRSDGDIVADLVRAGIRLERQVWRFFVERLTRGIVARIVVRMRMRCRQHRQRRLLQKGVRDGGNNVRGQRAAKRRRCGAVVPDRRRGRGSQDDR